jgi:ribosomal protein S18 acetylase RimI-like enzyme
MEKVQSYRWWKAQELEQFRPETILRMREIYCVAACSRFKTMNYERDHAWVLSAEDKVVCALLLHSRGTLFPVFNGKTDIEAPFFLERSLKSMDIYSLQGLAQEVAVLENMLRPYGYISSERVNYKLMAYDESSPSLKFKSIPRNLVFRKATRADISELLPLQAAYVKEEVLPRGSVFDPRACLFNIENIVSKEKCLVALMNGKIVAKINTNAESFSRYQVGGVFVLPSYRRRGIGSYLTATFTRLLLAENRGINLFVNKKNKIAHSVYLRCGFKDIADYRVAYM